MSVSDLVAELERAGVQLWEDDGRLRFRAPKGLMTEERVQALREHKDAVLDHVRGAGAGHRLEAAPAARLEPFPLSDVQAAYLLGRRDVFDYGRVACHGYGELEFADLDPARIEEAWAQMIERHDMLRAVVAEDGSQRVLGEVPRYEVAVLDLRDAGAPAVAAALLITRDELDHRVPDPSVWPLFELRVTLSAARAYLHLSIDFLIADFVSIQLLLTELQRRYADEGVELPPVEPTFRDYLLAERRLRSGARYERDRAWWLARLDRLPPAPELPVLERAREAPPRFARHEMRLDEDEWSAFRAGAAAHGITPSVGVLTAYAATIGRWSRRGELTLNLTLLNRLPLHPQIDQVVGDFTSVELLAVRDPAGAAFAARARELQAQLWEDLDHRLFSGVEILRELGRRDGAGSSLFPVVFTSAVGLADESDPSPPLSELGYGISQTPQVWIDCQVMERRRRLSLNWDVRQGIFPDGVVEEMFAAFARLLRLLASQPGSWDAGDPVELPEAQARRRQRSNDTAAPVPEGLLHDAVIAAARRTPDRLAVIDRAGALTYGELRARATAVAQALLAAGVRPGARVAVAMQKGAEQVVGVLGALLAGAAYVPIDTAHPPERRNGMLARAGVRQVLTQSWLVGSAWPGEVALIAVDEISPAPASVRLDAGAVTPGELAYVIYTSGSTGVPKGVMISHRAALNTVHDVSRRYGIGREDCVLGLAALGFDLSVYDVFGALGLGGCLVLPDPDRRGDPSHWAELIRRHGVSVWNSVPVQLQMLGDYLRAQGDVELPSLRLAMLSGDWIPVGLPDQIRAQIPGLRLIAMGGATEAAIWSIFHPIEEVAADARSIPYGRPLANQSVHVLDERLRSCPDWTVGELFIGGLGLAQGYLGDDDQTAARFIVHPSSGERLYRTGDLGRYLPDGEIEFLGREDSQVKIRGHRIELTEVESALLAHPSVGAAAVLAHGAAPVERRLAAFVEPRRIAADGDGDPVRARLLAAATQAGAAAMTGVDPDRYLAYAEALDAVALLAMVGALRRSGLFATAAARHTLEEVFERTQAAPRHHRLLRRWLRALCASGTVERDADGRYGRAPDVEPATLERAWQRVGELQRGVDDGAAALVSYFRASTEHLPALLRGEQDPLNLLFPDGRLEVADSLYRDALVNRWSAAMLAASVRAIVERLPEELPARVLEVGGGVGGSTVDVLAALGGRDVDYLFTDLSQFFLNVARERFVSETYVRYGVFDLDRDAREQGLTPNAFDVVVAADVLHSTRHVDETLARLSELIAPGGWLVFAEMTRDHYQIMASLELLTRVDDHARDFVDLRAGRDQTFLAREQWLAALSAAGAEQPVALPELDDRLAELGMQVFAARFKADRAALRAEDVRARAAQRLPEYMIPAQLQVVDTLPLTPNGKVDQRRLRAWLSQPAGTPSAGQGAPETELERCLAEVWAEMLDVTAIDRERGFFDLGGDSLLAAQIAGRLREVVPAAAAVFFDDLLRMLLAGPSVAGLAATIASGAPAERRADAPAQSSPLVTLAPGGGLPPRVLLSGAAGMSSRLGALIDELAADGGLLGLEPTPEDAEALTRGEAETIDRLAAAYARLLLSEGHLALHLVGLDAGAVLAVEVARHLLESGADVLGVTVLGPAPAAPASPYAGDVTLLAPLDDGRAADGWRACCLGEVVVVPVPGMAATAVEAPHAAALAAAIVAGDRAR